MFLLSDVIDKICESHAGIVRIRITDPMNLTNDILGDPLNGLLVPTNDIYDINYRNYNAEYTESSGNNSAGDFITKEITCLVPRRRNAVEDLIRKCANRHVGIVAFNQYDQKIILPKAKLSYSYTSGKKLGDNEAYELRFKAYDDLKGNYYIPDVVTPAGINNPTPGLTPIIGTSPIGNQSPPPPEPVCCITIVPTQLSTTPTAVGNAIINQIVIGADGNKYFIDHLGAATVIGVGGTTARILFTTPGTTYNLPAAWIVSQSDLLVIRNGKVQLAVSTLIDIDQYILTGNVIEIHPDWPLDASGEYIEVIRLS
jgi:hypothetical protein